MHTTTAGVDLLDPDTFARGVPFAALDAAREAGIVACESRHAETQFWLLARHADVSRFSRDVEGFSSQLNGTILGPRRRVISGGGLESNWAGPPALTVTDPPRHTFLRKTVHQWFTPRAVARLEHRVREAVSRILDDVAPRGLADIVEEIAAPLPAEIGGWLLGIPPQDRRWIASVGDEINGAEDPDYVEATREVPPLETLTQYLHHQLSAERFDPEGLVPALARTDIDGQRLTRQELEWMFILLVVASNGTTRDAISSGLHALTAHPAQLQRLRDDPSLVGPAADEVLRWATPVLYFARTATRDIEIHGQHLAAGDEVMLSFAGANFDPDVFDDPTEFDIGRRPNAHITFGGGGPHICLGAHLARLEVRLMLEQVARRMPALRLDGKPARLRSHINNGWKRMPIAWDV